MRHFLTLKNFSKEELYEILFIALTYKYNLADASSLDSDGLAEKLKTLKPSKERDKIANKLNLDPRMVGIVLASQSYDIASGIALKNKNVAIILEKPSTRTRVSFEVGVRQLGGDVVVLTGNDTQIGRGEPIQDTARVLSRMVDMIIIRTFDQSRLEELARFSSVPVINGLTDMYHPAQVLADMMTLIECGIYERDFAQWWEDRTRHYTDTFRSFLKSACKPCVAYIGDGNNIAHSWLNLASIFGLELRIATPKGYEPQQEVVDFAKQKALDSGAKIVILDSAQEAVREANVVITDTWVSMGQEEGKQRRIKDFQGFCVDNHLMSLAASEAIFLHCLPAYRGYEVSDEVIEGQQSRVWDEAENRLHIQKGIMKWLIEQNQ